MLEIYELEPVKTNGNLILGMPMEFQSKIEMMKAKGHWYFDTNWTFQAEHDAGEFLTSKWNYRVHLEPSLAAFNNPSVVQCAKRYSYGL